MEGDPAFRFPFADRQSAATTYNVTDSVIVGQFLGKESLAAVSASFFIYYFIISLVIGIGSGTSVGDLTVFRGEGVR